MKYSLVYVKISHVMEGVDKDVLSLAGSWSALIVVVDTDGQAVTFQISNDRHFRVACFVFFGFCGNLKFSSSVLGKWISFFFVITSLTRVL